MEQKPKNPNDPLNVKMEDIFNKAVAEKEREKTQTVEPSEPPAPAPKVDRRPKMEVREEPEEVEEPEATAEETPVVEEKPEASKGLFDNIFEAPSTEESPVEEEETPSVEDEEEPVQVVETPKVEEEDEPDFLPNDPPRYKKRMEKAKKRWEEEKAREIEALRKELESAKQVEPATEKPSGMTDEERTELIQLRRRFAIDKDPEFTNQFDEPLKANQDRIKGILKKHNMSDENLAVIDNLGGFDTFAESHPELARQILEKVSEDSVVDAEVLKGKLSETISLKDAKQRAIEKAMKDADKYFEGMTEKQKQSIEQANKQREQVVKTMEVVVDEYAKQPIFSDVPVTDGMGEQERKRAESINARRATVRQKMKEAVAISDPREAAQLAVAAAYAFELKAQLNEAQTELKAAKDQLAKIKKASTTRPSNTATPPKPPKQQQPSRPQDPIAGFDQGVEQLMKAKRNGL